MKRLWVFFAREVRLSYAGGGGPSGPAAFYLAALTLAPIAIGPDALMLSAAGPGLVGLTALFACLQSAERLYTDDLQDGSLELYLLCQPTLAWISLARHLGFLVAVLFPLPAISAIAALAYGLNVYAAFIGSIAICLALPGLVMISSTAGALAAGTKRSGLLIGLIAAPLQLPILVFACGAARSASENSILVGPNLLMTTAISLFVIGLSPFASEAALKAKLN